MLVLRRRAGEGIVLDGGIEIEVIEISRTRVKLGVRAPRDITVARRETIALADENRRASDLIAHRGHDGVGNLLRLMQQTPAEHSISDESPKADRTSADM